MNRLQEQIAKKQEELNSLISFSNEKVSIFESQLETIKAILKPYKVGEINADNSFVDYSPIDNKMIFRVYLKISGQLLSKQQQKNIESKLRAANVPMPICPVGLTSISLVYHN